MAASELIGLITCPMCGNENATVQKMTTGSRKNRLYFRCYESAGSSVMKCGTIQCIGPDGQKFISEKMRPVSAQVPKNPPKPKPARAIAQKPAIAPEAVPHEPLPVEPEPAIAPEPIPVEPEPVIAPENEPQPTSGDEPAPAPVKKSLWQLLRENPNG
jgi:hypothetical protein